VAASSITHDRVELKYKLTPAHAAEFSRGLTDHVTEHRFEGKGENRSTRAQHYVTTIYFDTASRALYRAVHGDDDNLKIRAREYYDLPPELLELATHAGEIARGNSVLWVEIKGKYHGRTYKRRVGIPKSDVAAFFERGEVSEAMLEIQRKQRGAAADDVIAELLRLREQHAEPLRPSCLVNYRRAAFQNETNSLRITLDQHLACFAPTPELLAEPRALLREMLGTPAYEERAIVLEVKVKEELPDWLQDLLQRARAERTTYSKFMAASEAVHGALRAVAPSRIGGS
jgi:hypothetical protein